MGERSAASERHRATDGRTLVASIDDEIVALGFAADGFVDGSVDHGFVRRGAQGRTKIGGIVLSEAHIKHASASQAHAVAGLAEIMAERRNEAKPSSGLAYSNVARWTARAIIERIHEKAFRQIGLDERE